MSALTLSRPAIAIPAFTPRAAPRKSGPAYPSASLFLLAATALYLCVELPFAARLVDVLSSNASEAEIHAVETTGRTISGCALALAAWGYMLRPRKPKPGAGRGDRRKPLTTAVDLTVVAAVCIVAMFLGQRTLVDRIAEDSGPALRAAAVKAAILRNEVFGARPAKAGSEGDAALAAFKGATASLASAAPDAFALVADPAAATRAFVASGFPTLARFKADAYAPAIDKARTSYEAYRRGVAALSGARQNGIEAADRAWSRMVSDLRASGVTDPSHPSVRARVARRMRDAGIPVPANWDPRDRATLTDVLVHQARERAEISYRLAVESNLGNSARLPTDIDGFDRFLAAPAVQASLRKSLGIEDASRSLGREASDAAYAHAAARAGQAVRLARALNGNADALVSDSRLDGTASSAVRLAVAPALALVLSAIGAFGHMAKMLHHGLAFAGGGRIGPRARLAAASLFLACLCAASPLPQALKDTKLWASASGSALAWPVAWSVGAHGLIHPVGQALSFLPGLAMAERASALAAR